MARADGLAGYLTCRCVDPCDEGVASRESLGGFLTEVEVTVDELETALGWSTGSYQIATGAYGFDCAPSVECTETHFALIHPGNNLIVHFKIGHTSE